MIAMRLWRLNETPFVIAIVIGLIGCASGDEYKRFILGGFSPDGSRLALAYCTKRQVCKFGYLELATRSFFELTPPSPDQVFGPGAFSPDGLRIAVSIKRKSENGRFAQIAIFDLPTSRVMELTSTPSYKSMPSFSHDGRKVIFAQSNRERTSGATRFADWDIYEIGTDGKNQRKLTAFKFFLITPPAYIPDDQHFIFSGDAPHAYVSPSGAKGYKAYQAKFGEHTIFVLPSFGEQHLVPYLTNGDLSSFPVISADGRKIVYQARTDKLDGVKTRFTYDLFLHDGEVHKRLTRLDSAISDITLSRDGSAVALVAQPHKRLDTLEPKLLDVNNGRMEVLDPAGILNERIATPH